MDPKNAGAYYSRGSVCLVKGEYNQAIGDLSNSIELNPSNGKAYNNRGVAYSNKGEHDKAVRDFKRALQLAQASGDKKLIQDAQSNLEFYKSKRP